MPPDISGWIPTEKIRTLEFVCGLKTYPKLFPAVRWIWTTPAWNMLSFFLLSLLQKKILIGKQRVSLVGGFNPFEKYARQNGNLPQFSGWKFQKYLKPPPSSRVRMTKCDKVVNFTDSSSILPPYISSWCLAKDLDVLLCHYVAQWNT